jgi:hypothetical protein
MAMLHGVLKVLTDIQSRGRGAASEDAFSGVWVRCCIACDDVVV